MSMDSLTRILNSSARTRRLTALAMTGATALSVLLIGAAIASSVYASRSDVREKRAQLGRLQAVLALKPMLEKSATAALAAEDRPEFLRGASDAVIQADLQTWINDIARAQGVTILSVGNAPALQQKGMRFAGLRVDLSGTNEGIQGTIFAIEAAKPYLIIRQAQLHSTLTSQEVAIDGPVELVLRVQFYGALPPPAASAAPKPAGATQ
jgi:hypothetical protein